MVGRWVERLRAIDQFDSSWLIVTSDHGMNFEPLTFSRSTNFEHLAAVLPVPLLVKPPGRTSGRRFDHYVELVDVAVTLAEELGFELPCDAEGRSLYSSTRRA